MINSPLKLSVFETLKSRESSLKNKFFKSSKETSSKHIDNRRERLHGLDIPNIGDQFEIKNDA